MKSAFTNRGNKMKIAFAKMMGIALMLLMAGVASAETPERRLIHGIFYAVNGEEMEFNAVEGMPLSLTNIEKNQSYSVVANIVGKDQVKFSIMDSQSKRVIDTFWLKADGKPVSGSAFDFALAVKGITIQKPGTESGGGLGTKGSCCTSPCNGWVFCCTPAPGYCCTVRTACGGRCSACTP